MTRVRTEAELQSTLAPGDKLVCGAGKIMPLINRALERPRDAILTRTTDPAFRAQIEKLYRPIVDRSAVNSYLAAQDWIYKTPAGQSITTVYSASADAAAEAAVARRVGSKRAGGRAAAQGPRDEYGRLLPLSGTLYPSDE